MTDEIPRECAEAFIDIKVALAALPEMARKLDMIHRALFGNGKPTEGHVARLERLEEAQADVKTHWQTIRRRMVELAVGATLLYIGTRFGG